MSSVCGIMSRQLSPEVHDLTIVSLYVGKENKHYNLIRILVESEWQHKSNWEVSIMKDFNQDKSGAHHARSVLLFK